MELFLTRYQDNSFWMRRIRSFVDNNLGEAINLEDVASAAGLSRYSLCRLFRSRYNISPMRWLIQIRLETSRSMIIEKPAIPLADIAVFCGFSSPSHLTRCFKKVFGLAPSELRRTYHDIDTYLQTKYFAQAG